MTSKILILFLLISLSCSDDKNDNSSSKIEITDALYKYDCAVWVE